MRASSSIQSDPGVFIRSTAAGERLGGLAWATRAAAHALAAAFDVVVIETVGVGQAETEVADVADTVAVVVQPGGGDALQFLKAGIMEIPDVLVVTKADLGQIAAHRARGERRAALARLGHHAVLAVLLAAAAAGIDELLRRPGGAPPASDVGTRRLRARRAQRPLRLRSRARRDAACARSAGDAPPSGLLEQQEPTLDTPALVAVLERGAASGDDPRPAHDRGRVRARQRPRRRARRREPRHGARVRPDRVAASVVYVMLRR